MFQLHELSVDSALSDFQHTVDRTIALHEGDAAFPDMAQHGVTRDMLDSYLFDRQAILDSGGSQRTRGTVAGVLIVLPVLVMSAVPERQRPGGEWAILVAVAVGLLLFLAYLIIMRIRRTLRLRSLDREQPDCAAFVNAVRPWMSR